MLVINFSSTGRAATVDLAHNPGGYTGDDGMWGNIPGDDCAGCHDSASKIISLALQNRYGLLKPCFSFVTIKAQAWPAQKS